MPKKMSNAKYYAANGTKKLAARLYQEAIEELSRAISLEPGNADYYRSRASAYHQLKHLEQAVKDYTQAIQFNKADITSYNNRAAIYYQQKLFAKAIEDYSKAIASDPTYEASYHNRAIIYHQLAKYELALQDYAKAIELNEHNSAFYSGRADTYYALKLYTNALENYNQAIHLNADSAIAFNGRGNCYVALKLPNKAINDYTRALELNANNPNYYKNRANSYCELKLYANALSDFNRAIELNPKQAHYHFRRSEIFCYLKDYTSALTDADKALSLNPQCDAHYVKGFIHLASHENLVEAIVAFNQTLRVNPDCLAAYRLRAYALYLSNQPQESIDDSKYYIKAKQDAKEPISALVWLNLSMAYLKLNEPQLALDAYEEVKKAYDYKVDEYDLLIPGTNIEALVIHTSQMETVERECRQIKMQQAVRYAARAKEECQCQKYSSAFTAATQAIVLDVDNPIYYELRSNIAYKLKDFSQAAQDAEAAIKLDSKQFSYYYCLAKAQQALAQYAEALYNYRHALSLQPGSPAVHYRMGNLYALSQNYMKARAEYTIALKSKPTNLNYLYQYALVSVCLGEYNNALDLTKQILTLDPNYIQAYYIRGITRLALNQQEQALEDLNRILAMDMRHISALANRGYSYYLLEQYDAALSDYNRLLETLREKQSPIPAIIWFGRGLIHDKVGNLDAALADYEAADKIVNMHQSITPYHLWTSEEQSIGLTSLSQCLQQARRKHLRLRHETALSLVQMSEHQFEQQSYQLALKRVDEALSMDETCIEAYLLQAKIYRQLERWHEAISSFKIVQNKQPQNVEVGLALAETELQLERVIAREASLQWLASIPQEIAKSAISGAIDGLAANDALGLASLNGACPSGKLEAEQEHQLQQLIIKQLELSQILNEHFKPNYQAILVYEISTKLRLFFAVQSNSRFFAKSARPQTVILTAKLTDNRLLDELDTAMRHTRRRIIRLNPNENLASKARINNTSIGTVSVTEPLVVEAMQKPVQPLIVDASPLQPVKSRIDGKKYISLDMSLVSLVRKKKSHSDAPEHAFLMLESMAADGSHRISKYHMVENDKHRGYGLVIVESIQADNAEQAATELSDKLLGGLSIKDCCFQAWNISLDQTTQLQEAIQFDEKRSKEGRLTYLMLGNSSLFKQSGLKSGHNCFTWAREKLEEINIHLGQKWTDFFVAKTSHYLPDQDEKNKNCLVM